jgi:iron-sulfur cluster repair protein YtfE (RIC family)
MTIFELLAQQHVEIEAAFRDIHAALERKEHGPARALFAKLSTKLLASMRSEHAVVYPAFAYEAGLEDEVKRAIREHQSIEQSINHLRLIPLSLDSWQGALTRLQVLVADHLETEEWILFPVARLRLSPAQATKLAAEFLAFQTIALPTTSCSITYDAA